MLAKQGVAFAAGPPHHGNTGNPLESLGLEACTEASAALIVALTPLAKQASEL